MFDFWAHFFPLTFRRIAVEGDSAKLGLDGQQEAFPVCSVFTPHQESVLPLLNFCPNFFTGLASSLNAGNVFIAACSRWCSRR